MRIIQHIDKKITAILILGIILRIILMVSSCHFDLLSYYWDAHRMVYHGVVPEIHAKEMLITLWLFIIRPLINQGKDLWPEVWFPQNDFMKINIEAWQNFVSQPEISKTLFLFKFPCFITELLMIFLLFKIISSGDSKYKLLNFLIFNPISLFITYILGAFDIIMIFFFVLSLFFIKKRKIYLGTIILGLSIIIKPYSLFLLPLFIIILSRDWLKRITLFILGALPLIIILFFRVLCGESAKSLFLKIVNFPVLDFPLSLTLPFQHIYDRLFPFVLSYALLILSALYRLEQNEDLFKNLIKYITAYFLIFYSLSFFHPQFFLFIVPLMFFQIKDDKRFLSLFLFLVFFYFFYTFQWGRDLSWRLFMPLNPDFFVNLKSPSEFIVQFYPMDKFIGIIRSIFSAILFWMIYLLIRKDTVKIKLDNEAET